MTLMVAWDLLPSTAGLGECQWSRAEMHFEANLTAIRLSNLFIFPVSIMVNAVSMNRSGPGSLAL